MEFPFDVPIKTAIIAQNPTNARAKAENMSPSANWLTVVKCVFLHEQVLPNLLIVFITKRFFYFIRKGNFLFMTLIYESWDLIKI